MGARLVAIALGLGLVGCGGGALAHVKPPEVPTSGATVGVPARARYQYLIGRLAIEEADWETAESALQTALLHDPGSPWLWLALADVSAGTGEDAQELARVQEATRLGPTLPDAWTRLGNVQVKQGDVRGALQSYREAIDFGAGTEAYAPLCRLLVQRSDPLAASMVRAWSAIPMEDAETLHERGRLRLLVGDLTGATADLGEALMEEPKDARLLDEFLTAVTGSGSYRQGLARLVTLHRLVPGDTDVLLRTYHLAAQAHDQLRAIDALEALDSALAGRESQVKLWLADAYSAVGRHDDARRTMEAGTTCQPPLADAGYHRARIARAAGQPAEALKLLKIPENGANRADALALRARLLVDLGKAAEARAGLVQALKDLPDDYALLGALVTACAAEGDREGMLAAVDKMAMLDGEARARTRARSLAGIGDLDGALLALHGAGLSQPESWIVGGTLLRDAGRTAEAVDWLTRGVDRFPKHAALRAELGLATAAAGDKDAAIVVMREALKLDAAEPRAVRFMADNVDLDGPRDRLVQVRTWVLAALERQPADAGLLAALGRIEFALDEPLRAVEAWEEATRYDPGDRQTLAWLANAYRAVGRLPQAAAVEARIHP